MPKTRTRSAPTMASGFRTSVSGKAWKCFWTLALEEGQLTVEGPSTNTSDSVLAITAHRQYAGRAARWRLVT